MESTDLRQKIEEIIKAKVKEIGRPDLFREPMVGFASCDMPELVNIKETVGPWHKLPEDQLPGARTVIAFCVPSTQEVAKSPAGSKFSGLVWSEAYDLINENFVIISNAVVDFLRSQGYEASTFKATNDYDHSDPVSSWSHRTMACAAGLGTFGLNRILMTRKGSAVRYCSLVTDAVIEPTGPYDGPVCLGLNGGSCDICLKACPVDALTRWFDGGKFDCQELQDNYHDLMLEEWSVDTSGTCGKCISSCPLCYIE